MYSEALVVVESPLQLGEYTDLPMEVLVEEAVRRIVKEAPERGMSDICPQIEGLAHLVRVFVAAEKHGNYRRAVGFLRLQLDELESLIRQHPGDSAQACRYLGSVIARGLEVLGRDKDETYVVPDIFRMPVREWLV